MDWPSEEISLRVPLENRISRAPVLKILSSLKKQGQTLYYISDSIQKRITSISQTKTRKDFPAYKQEKNM